MATRMRKLGTGRSVLLALGGLLVLWVGGRQMLGTAVPAVRVERRPLVQRVVANGRVYVPVVSRLGANGGGTIAGVNVRQGDRVEAGDLLIELVNGSERAEVARAEARLQQLRELDTRTAAEDLTQAEVNLRQAERDLKRQEALFDSGLVASQAIEDSRKGWELARSRVESARAQVRSTRPGGSAVRLAEADLEAARAQLEDTRVRAPAAGQVLVRQAEPGDAVQAGAPLLVFAHRGETCLLVEPEEKALALLQVGQEASASTDAYPERVFQAEVSEIAPSVDPDRGTVEVKLRVPEPPTELRPDMTVSVNIEVARKTDALVLPPEAVRDLFTGRPYVLAVRGGRAVRVPVVLGIRGEDLVEITSGLSAGELVVTGVRARLEGKRVRASRQES